MTDLFGVPIDTMTTILVVTTAVIVGGTLLLALFNGIFFKIGVRNIPRRRAQMLLIVFALMLSTTLLTGVLATGDVVTAAGQSVAVYNLGSVDETITGSNNRIFDDYIYKISQRVMGYIETLLLSQARWWKITCCWRTRPRARCVQTSRRWRSFLTAKRASEGCRTPLPGRPTP